MIDKEVMQMALQKMEYMLRNGEWYEPEKAIEALRTALAQPEPEPVAQWQKRHLMLNGAAWENTNEGDAKWWRDNSDGWEIRALYTAPPQRKPLSEEQIEAISEASVTNCYFDTITFARALEAAHCIGEVK